MKVKGSSASVSFALLAAIFYGMSVPAAKLLLSTMSPVFMAALLYLGAGLGMLVVNFTKNKRGCTREARLTKRELPFTAAMIVLDIAAPILLMWGLTLTTAATASLLGNFEIVATTLVALFAFKESVGKRMWLAVILITASSVILSVTDLADLHLSLGVLLVLLGCVCWGVENNCTRMLSLKDPVQIVVVKGIGAGCGSLLIVFITGGVSFGIAPIGIALLLGFVAYGMSIYLYILAQRSLGASRTSVFFALAPFVGVALSFMVFRELPALSFWIALAVMGIGAYLAASERHSHMHTHEALTHEHRHNHTDGHHNHVHVPPFLGEHSHSHTHEVLCHTHSHTPDLHHTHSHSS